MKAVVSFRHEPAFNLALEQYLFEHSSGDYLLFYVNDPCVILGSNQVLSNEVNAAYCNQHEIRILRRITGGGAVYHDRGNLNFSFIRSKIKEQPVLNDDFLLPVVQVLNELGIPAVAGKRRDIWLAEGYKITGTASHIRANRVIQHGTLLYDADLEKLQLSLMSPVKDKAKNGIPSVPSPVKNICTYFAENGRNILSAEDFFELFIQRMKSMVGAEISLLHETDFNMQIIEEIADVRYLYDAWTAKK